MWKTKIIVIKNVENLLKTTKDCAKIISAIFYLINYPNI